MLLRHSSQSGVGLDSRWGVQEKGVGELLRGNMTRDKGIADNNTGIIF